MLFLLFFLNLALSFSKLFFLRFKLFTLFLQLFGFFGKLLLFGLVLGLLACQALELEPRRFRQEAFRELFQEKTEVFRVF